MKLKRFFAAAVAFAVLLVNSSARVFAESAGAQENNEQQTTSAPVRPGESMIYLPNEMRAVVVTPGTDFDAEGLDMTDMYDNIADFGLNAVIINSVNGDDTYYNLELDSKSRDILNMAIDGAHDNNLSAFLTLDAGSLIKTVSSDGGGLKEGFSAAAHKFAMKYNCEGIILTNYYTRDSEEMYAEYLLSGSGIGYENWLYETNQYIFRTISEVVHKTNNTTAVGVLVEDMWANSVSNAEGSDTEDNIQALYDGHCDTKKYIESGYADFAIVKAYGHTEDYSLKFENVVKWWDGLTQQNNVRMYVCHLNERIGVHAGWYEDQLLRQLAILEDYEKIGGSAFNSLSALKENPLGSTDKLIDYFNDKINTSTLFEDLTMISPTQTNFVTYDTTVKFMGTFDENFNVYFDNQKIQLNEKGNFYIPKELQVGRNTFTIEHKGKQINYSIQRRVDVLKSIESTADIRVEGGTRLSFVAVAYSGSSVTATINGETIKLNEKDSSEGVGTNSSYSEFVGYYTVADGIIGQEQYLGHVSYYAYYMGEDESMTGGSITIEAKPEPPKTDIEWNLIPDQSAVGTGEVVGTIAPILTDDDPVTYVRVKNNFTDVMDGMTTGRVPSPEFTQLPAGTLDYYKSSADGYIITTSGKRFRSDYVTVFDDTGLDYNALVVDSIGNSGGRSFIKFTLDSKSSFNVNTSIEYYSDYDEQYKVKKFDAEYVYITFDNVTSVTKLPDFDACSLFRGGEWETVIENDVPKFRLKLTLRQAGIYSGVRAIYDENGDLLLTFSIPTPTLAGKTIVIDPGHGYNENGVFDPGAIGEVTEQSITIEVAKKLEAKLSAMGANVIRLKTEQYGSNLGDRERPQAAVEYVADMCMSLHCNAATNPNAHGVEVYYFTPWSQTLAKYINDNLVSLYDGIYNDGTNSNRGDKYSYYWYTLEQSFPSVLVEMGFVTNQRECMMMADSDTQDKMAEAIANAIYSYFARSSLGY